VKYEVAFRPSAEKEFLKLEKLVQKRIVKKLEELASNPFPRGVKKLEGHDTLYRVRANAHRIIYEVLHQEITVLILHITDRKEAYRGI
jgi:mRNA interferase RelE/StbE